MIAAVTEAPKTSTFPTARQGRLRDLIDELDNVFLERTDLIKLLLTAYIAKTNLFIGGPPGTGKTQLSKAVAAAFDSRSFYYLMGATTQPDEVLGAVDLAALKDGEFRRDLDGKLADVELAILDEIFKSNSPCLNTLLGIILDHEIPNGKTVHKCPLISLVGCSNELPQEDSLAPFWDRFTLRYWVEDVSIKNKKVLMMREAGLEKAPAVTVGFTLEDLDMMQFEASTLPIDSAAIDCILEVSKRLEAEGISASTRKHVQMIGLIRAWAYVSGDAEVNADHLEVLQHIFWNDLKQREAIAKAIKQILEAPLEALSKILGSATTVFDKAMKIDFSESGNLPRAKAFLGGADSKLAEMLAQVSKIMDNAPRDSRLYTSADRTHAEIFDMRQRIMSQLALVEFGL